MKTSSFKNWTEKSLIFTIIKVLLGLLIVIKGPKIFEKGSDWAMSNGYSPNVIFSVHFIALITLFSVVYRLFLKDADKNTDKQ
jgi:hypothetical protein